MPTHIATDCKSAATTDAIDTTGADILIGALVYFVGTGNPTITDNKSNSWVSRDTRTSSSPVLQIYDVDAPSSVGSGHTATNPLSAAFPAAGLTAWSGSIASAFDTKSGNTTSSGTSRSLSLTPNFDNCLVLAFLGLGGGGSNPQIDDGFTILDSVNPGSNFGLAIAWKFVATAAPQAPNWTWTGNAHAAGAIASWQFNAVGGGGGNPWYHNAQQRVRTSLGRRWDRRGLLWTPDYAAA